MTELMITIVKLAGLSTLAILCWAAWTARRAARTGEAPETDNLRDEVQNRDPVGAAVMRAMTVMLIIGAAAMFTLSLMPAFA